VRWRGNPSAGLALSLQWISEARPVLLIGQAGVGKNLPPSAGQNTVVL